MKPSKVLSVTVLSFLFGMVFPANARQEKPEEKAKPAQQEQAKPAAREQQAKPAQPQHQDQAAKQKPDAKSSRQEQAQAPRPQQRQQPQANTEQQRKSANRQQQGKTQQQSHQQQAKYAHPPQRSQQEVARQHAQPALRLSVRGSGRIPDDRFRSNFGRGHAFRIGAPVLVDGYSRFQYGGFWFGFVEPWPANWYYTDDVYIDYVDGGYYMYNPYYPGARFSINVVM